jgi:hypothetical protein
MNLLPFDHNLFSFIIHYLTFIYLLIITGIVDFEWSFIGPKNMDLVRGLWWIKEDKLLWKIVENEFNFGDDIHLNNFILIEQTISKIMNAFNYYKDEEELKQYIVSEKQLLRELCSKYL